MKLKILLTNDDGISAAGLRTMQKALTDAGHELIVVAPHTERSASSHSLSLQRDLRVRQLADNEYSVDGTPVDCVVVALQHIIKEPVDLVISGINAGQNMGEDVLYSGTVAAALEAALNGNKAIAVSLNSYRNQNFEPTAAWIVKLLELGLDSLCEPGMVLNINFPHLPYDEIKGIRLTQTGHRRYYNFIRITAEHEDGFSYRIGGDNPNWINLEGSDADAVKAGFISITPLGFKLTNVQCFPAVLEWLETRGLLRLEK